MNKFVFATQEDVFVKFEIDTDLSSRVYEYTIDVDLVLFVSDTDMTNEQFVEHYKKYYSYLDFEVHMSESNMSESFEAQVRHLLQDERNNFIIVE